MDDKVLLNLEIPQFIDPHRVNLKKLKSLFEEAFEKIKAAQNQEVVLVVGNTGAGKSTSINYLMGSKMFLNSRTYTNEFGDQCVEDGEIAVASGEKEYAKIGSDLLKSQTLYAEVTTVGPDGFAYCDCTGFQDSRSNEEGIISSLGTYLAIKFSKNIKALVITIDYSSFDSTRAKGFKNLCETLGHLLPNLSELVNSDPTIAERFFKTLKLPFTGFNLSEQKPKPLPIIFLITKVPPEVSQEKLNGKIYQLAKSAVNALYDPEDTDQKDKESRAYIASLMLACKDNVFALRAHEMVYDPIQPLKSEKVRGAIIHHLSKLQDFIPKEQFALNDEGESFSKLRSLIIRMTTQINYLLSNLSALPTYIEYHEIDRQQLQETKHFDEIRLGKFGKLSKDKTIETLKKAIKKNEDKIEEYNILVCQLEEEIIPKLEKELMSFEDMDEKPYWKFTINTQPWWFPFAQLRDGFLRLIQQDETAKQLASTCVATATVKYDDVPFLKCEAKFEEKKGKLIVHREIQEIEVLEKNTEQEEKIKKGIYDACYEASPLERAVATINIYVAKKYSANYCLIFLNTCEELSQKQKMLQEYKKQIGQLTEQKEKWSKAIHQEQTKEEIREEIFILDQNIYQKTQEIERLKALLGKFKFSIRDYCVFQSKSQGISKLIRRAIPI